MSSTEKSSRLPAGECGGSELQHCCEGGHCRQGPEGEVVDCGLGHSGFMGLVLSLEKIASCLEFEMFVFYCCF